MKEIKGSLSGKETEIDDLQESHVKIKEEQQKLQSQISTKEEELGESQREINEQSIKLKKLENELQDMVNVKEQTVSMLCLICVSYTFTNKLTFMFIQKVETEQLKKEYDEMKINNEKEVQKWMQQNVQKVQCIVNIQPR